MSITITRNPENGGNLFFTSGQISFSELRRHFTDDQPGFGSQISASQLRRDTDVRKENPIVPDATHNEQISTGSNLRLSQFRNSVKRYLATQSGTDDNNGRNNEPGLRLGLFDPNGRGLDFAGGGVNGRDGQGGNSTGNHTKNVQKGVLITGTCGSVQPGVAAAQLAPRVTVHNFRINVSGAIFGYGGRGSGLNGWGSISGEDGGVALNLGSTGYNNRVIVGSGARIFGGGGGGEKGRTGNNGSSARCVKSETFRSGCQQGSNSCPGGWNQTASWQHCCRSRRGCSANHWYKVCEQSYNTSTPIGGVGGNGGHGRGYNHGYPSSLAGSGGGGRQCPSCNGGYSQQGGSCSQNGENGGNGGDWGQNGGNTADSGNGGRGAAAIAATSGSGRYAVYGTVNSSTVRGSINGTV